MQHSLPDPRYTNMDIGIVFGGIFTGIGLPVLLVEQRSEIVDLQSTLPIAITTFGIVGLAMVTVGLKGLCGRYPSLDDRRWALLRTGSVLTVIVLAGFLCWTAAVAAFAAVKNFTVANGDFAETLRLIRLAGACIGAMAGFHVASRRPPADENKLFWFSVFGGAAGWCLAFLALKILLIAGAGFLLIRYAMPHLPRLWQRVISRQQSQPIAGNDPRIADLRRQITWTESCGAPKPFRDEEVARLNKQLRDLGGSP